MPQYLAGGNPDKFDVDNTYGFLRNVIRSLYSLDSAASLVDPACDVVFAVRPDLYFERPLNVTYGKEKWIEKKRS
jgi:hypothetical protein